MNAKFVFIPLAVSYIAIILILRAVFFVIDRTGLPEPQIIIFGTHLHHYIFGIGILLLVSLLSLHQKFSKATLAIMLGVGLALIIDEFQFLLKLAEVEYPSQELNFIFFTGIAMVTGSAIEYLNVKTEEGVLRGYAYPAISALISLKDKSYPSPIAIFAICLLFVLLLPFGNSHTQILPIAYRIEKRISTIVAAAHKFIKGENFSNIS